MAEKILIEDISCPICGINNTKIYSNGFDYEYNSCSNNFQFIYCDLCDIIYLSPRPLLESLPLIYPANYASYYFNKKNITYIIRNYLDTLKAKKLTSYLNNNAKIIDVGCGDTLFLDRLSNIKGKNFELWANDFDPTICEKIANAGYNVIAGRFEDVNIDDDFFDMIFLKQAIEHVDNPLAVLSKAYRALRLGGCLVIETPNFDAWDAKIFKKSFWGSYHFPRHWTIFNPRSLTNIATKVGFTLQKTDFLINPYGWILSFYNALASSKYVPKFVLKFFNIRNVFLVSFVSSIDIFQNFILNKTSNMRIILCKNK
jgi:ubiquinone/menaquinone biosynthesis C-methylase UbiE